MVVVTADKINMSSMLTIDSLFELHRSCVPESPCFHYKFRKLNAVIGNRVQGLMDFENELNALFFDNEITPIERLFRFWYIHPFYDGNGRVGRVFYLKEKGIDMSIEKTRVLVYAKRVLYSESVMAVESGRMSPADFEFIFLTKILLL